MNITPKVKKVQIKKAELYAWTLQIVALRKFSHNKYYKWNQRAKHLSAPAYHFYTRIVKLANFATGQGNVSKQFAFFGGWWRKSTIYGNLRRLCKFRLVKGNPGQHKTFSPVPGARRHYINKGVLDLVRTPQEALFLKYLLWLVFHPGDPLKATHRELIQAGFGAQDALFFLQYTREHLNKKWLWRLRKGTVWVFKALGDTARYWWKGAKRIHKFVNNPNATKTGNTEKLPLYEKITASNGPPRSSPGNGNAETATNRPHSWPNDLTGTSPARPGQPIALGSEIPPRDRRVIDTRKGGDKRPQGKCISGKILQGTGTAWDYLSDAMKQNPAFNFMKRKPAFPKSGKG